MPAAVEIDIDRADAVPPLSLEERRHDGSWVEVHHWSSLPPDEDLFWFRVPVGARAYDVRFAVSDRVGNLSRVVLDSREVEPAIRMSSMADGGRYPAGSNQPIRWTIHPALAEVEEQLVVEVSHRDELGGPWRQLYDGLRVDETCVWTLPASAAGMSALRLRLFHDHELIGVTESSRPFEISALEPKDEPAPSDVKNSSLALSERADVQFAKLVELEEELAARIGSAAETPAASEAAAAQRGSAGDTSLALEGRLDATHRLGEIRENVLANYHSALRKDPRNYHATYGLARMLRATEPEQAVQWLVETLRLEPEHLGARNDLAAAYIEAERFAEAEELLRPATASGRSDVVFNLALTLFYQDELVEARDLFASLLERSDGSLHTDELRYYLVACSLRGADVETARADLALHGPLMPASYRDSLEEALGRLRRAAVAGPASAAD
jgi:tetratricopeptide (TPR) repeat protein